jgi:hypothetical protein
MRWMPYFSNQSVEPRLVRTEQLSTEINNYFSCGALLQRKIILFERNKYIYHEIVAIHFNIIWKSVDNIEPNWIPYNREHKLFALNLLSRFCGDIISRQNLHPTWWCIEEKPRFITSYKMMPAITFGRMHEWKYIFCILLSFLEKSLFNRFAWRISYSPHATPTVFIWSGL